MHVITASRKDSLFRKARVALGALLLTLAGGVLAGERLHIFTEHYPPYNASTSGEEFAHSADEITGICTDMVKAILARTDFDYVMKVRAWSYVFDRVQGRPNHGLFCTARTEDRGGPVPVGRAAGVDQVDAVRRAGFGPDPGAVGGCPPAAHRRLQGGCDVAVSGGPGVQRDHES